MKPRSLHSCELICPTFSSECRYHRVSAFIDKHSCRTLQRVAIRLHVVLHTGNIKRAMAIHTVGACLELVEKRLDEARKTISVCIHIPTVSSHAYRKIDQLAIQVDGHAQGAKTGKKIDNMDAKVNEIHAHLLGTAPAPPHAA